MSYDFNRLLGPLQATGLSQKDPALFQIINTLIKELGNFTVSSSSKTGTTVNNITNNISNKITQAIQLLHDENYEESLIALQQVTNIINATLITNEVPSGSINGSNKVFTTANNFTSGSLLVYLNGIRQKLNDDYSETTSDTFTFSQAPFTGDLLTVDYNVSGAVAGPQGTQGIQGNTGAQGPMGPVILPNEYDDDGFILQLLSGSGSSSGNLVEAHTVSGASSIQFITGFNASLDSYFFQLENIIPSAGSNEVYIRFSTNGGVSYDSSSLYANSIWVFNSSGTSVAGNSIAALAGQIVLTDTFADFPTTANYGYAGSFRLLNNTSGYKRLFHFGNYLTGNTGQTMMGHGLYQNTSQVNALQIILKTGNISGTARMYLVQ